jgi:hypothetical protein
MSEMTKVLQVWATDELYSYLTATDRIDRARDYVQEGAQLVLSGRVRLKDSTRFGDKANLSEQAQSVTALRLTRSFGVDADCYGDLDTWPQHIACGLGMIVDYNDLADRLLQRLAPEYVPGEVRESGLGETEGLES